MKILLLTHRMPYPPDRGDRIRSYHMLRHLSQRHDIWLASVNDDEPDHDALRHLQSLCQNISIQPLSRLTRGRRALQSLAFGRSATEGYFWHPLLAQTVRRWAALHHFDMTFCYCSSMFRYTQIAGIDTIPCMVDLVDVDSRKWDECAQASRLPNRILKRLEAKRVQALETEIAAKASSVTIISNTENELYRSIVDGADAVVVPNGVDAHYFTPSLDPRAFEYSTCCFVGVLNYQPNIDGLQWFIDRIWREVRTNVADARFLIIGKSPHRVVKRLAIQPGVELLADVPDVRPYLVRSAVAIVPLRIARGLQNKVLEAMAMGKPVIATQAALQGIGARHEHEVLAPKTTKEWIEKVTWCLCNPSEAVNIGRRARHYVERFHNWNTSLKPLDDVLMQHAAPSARSAIIRSDHRCASPLRTLELRATHSIDIDC